MSPQGDLIDRRISIPGVTALLRASVGILAVSNNGLSIVAGQDNSEVALPQVDFPIEPPLTAKPNGRTNDAKVGNDGALWVGTMTDPPSHGDGNLFRLAMAGSSITCVSVREEVTISNGIAWIEEPNGFYYIDTPMHAIDFGHVRRSEVVFERVMALSPTLGDPDGMTISADGRLFVAMWGGSKVLVIDPNQENIVDRITVPAKFVTSCIFGGENFDTLFVTTATWEAAGEASVQPADDLGGSVFAVTGVGQGKAEPLVQIKV